MEARDAHILVICRDKDILATIVRLVDQQPGWKASGVVSDEEAVEQFESKPIDVVLIGAGVDLQSEKKLKQYFRRKPDVKVVQHFGGGSGLLFNEIHMALSK